ncbi:hypothetical protein SAY86_000448 [Trapa natans]|uniref:BHLH domain-containing protein n=1 Tax=Trapa natans TaxID=22666 RepID=A0AAN7MA89_TRANT|nr:hypothetical protein SAY86_000448 [Trapa natans]
MADSYASVPLDLEELKNTRGTFSQLLFADDLVLCPEVQYSETTNLGCNSTYLCSYSKKDLPKMLSFGYFQDGCDEVKAAPPSEPIICRIDPKESSCHTDISPKYLPECRSREDELAQSSSSTLSITTAVNGKRSKRSKKIQNGQTKPSRRLGERVAALQQLVSPYGKTDTASVLHEAVGYIRFLQEQVRVLCSPYLQQSPSLSEQHEGRGSLRSEGPIWNLGGRSLRSWGLCLVPVGCTIPMAACNGADFWSPASCNGRLSSSSPLDHHHW